MDFSYILSKALEHIFKTDILKSLSCASVILHFLGPTVVGLLRKDEDL